MRTLRWLFVLAVVPTVAIGLAVVSRSSRGAGGAAVPMVSSTSSATTAPLAASTTSSSPAATAELSADDAAIAAALGPVSDPIEDGCVAVWRDSQPVFESRADVPVLAASLTKVLTAVAAFDVLGPDSRFTTTAAATDAVNGGVLDGDLWVVGGGDPVLGTARWATATGASLYTPLDALADQVVAAGVRRIAGRVLGDDSRYDALRIVDTWPHRFAHDGEAGPLSALSVNDGFDVWGHPGVPFDDPAAGAATVFTELLRDRGVVVDGEAASGRAPAGAIPVGLVDSPPLAELVAAMLRDSDNGTAELLVKELGFRSVGEGSTAGGARVVRDTLAARGLPVDGSVVADGSGLSEAGRVTCRLMAALLASAPDLLRDRLAVAGRTGTLEHRFRGTSVEGRLLAKTGSVDGVAALAGYLDRPDGTLTFAHIVNSVSGARGRQGQDAFVTALSGA